MRNLIIVIITTISPLLLNGQVTNLDKLTQPERDSILIAAAKQIILKFGPDFYDENQPLIIKRYVITNQEEKNGGPERGFRAGRVKYYVGYFRSDHKEMLERFPHMTPYSTVVDIWEDTGLVGAMSFGDFGVCYSQEIDPYADPLPEHNIFVRAKPGEKRCMPKSEYDQWKKDNRMK